jgi:hypothetical protein
MVAIPLLCALYDSTPEEARRYVQWSTAQHRPTDAWCGAQHVHLPETDEQWRTVLEVQAVVRKHKR